MDAKQRCGRPGGAAMALHVEASLQRCPRPQAPAETGPGRDAYDMPILKHKSGRWMEMTSLSPPSLPGQAGLRDTPQQARNGLAAGFAPSGNRGGARMMGTKSS